MRRKRVNRPYIDDEEELTCLGLLPEEIRERAEAVKKMSLSMYGSGYHGFEHGRTWGSNHSKRAIQDTIKEECIGQQGCGNHHPDIPISEMQYNGTGLVYACSGYRRGTRRKKKAVR